MASKNILKTYVEGGYYHIYNRGVEKRLIFQDEQDYGVYLSYLKNYLSEIQLTDITKSLDNPDLPPSNKRALRRQVQINNFHNQIWLISYCLMPNHFHLFVKQSHAGAIDQFMNSLSTRYVMYFNRKYHRVGPLYQSRYRAVLINDEAQYLHITRYIHKQALAVPGSNKPDQPSSYPDYLELRQTSWVHPEEILSFFSQTNPKLSYEQFVMEYQPPESDDSDPD